MAQGLGVGTLLHEQLVVHWSATRSQVHFQITQAAVWQRDRKAARVEGGSCAFFHHWIQHITSHYRPATGSTTLGELLILCS